MMRLICATLLLASPAFAHSEAPPAPVANQAIANPSATASAAARSHAVARATGGAATAQGGAAYGGVGQGGSLTVTGAGIGNTAGPNHYSAYAPAVFAPPLVTSNDTCAGSASAGGSGSPFSFLFGWTWAMNGCETRAVSNQAIRLGRPDVAHNVMCQDQRWAKADPSCSGTPTPVAAPAEPGIVSDLRPSVQDCANARTFVQGWTAAQRAYFRQNCG